MPPVPGFLATGASAQHQRIYTSSDLDGYGSGWINALASHRSATSFAGALTSNLPVEANGAARSGWIARSYSDDYYHRIHVAPATVDFGNLTAQDTRSLYVWNAHLTAQMLGSIQSSGMLGGLTLSGQAAPPLAYAALQERIYTLTAATTGDPVIDALYRFVFANGEQPSARVSGRRVVLWAFAPNWDVGLTERMQWMTHVHAHRDGSEQRVRIRQHARRGFEYETLLAGRDTRRFEALLFGWGGRTYLVPWWPEADVTTAPLSAGATSITVTDRALKDYAVNGYVAVVHGMQAEAAQITAIAGNVLTLKTPLANAWPAGSRVLPAVFARLDGEVAVARITDSLLRARLRFALDEQYARDRAPAEIGPTFQSYAVMDWRPDRVDDVSEDWSRTLELLDALAGMVAVHDVTRAPVITRTLRWLIVGRAAIDAIKRWLAARAGSLVPFWLPSWSADLTPTQPIGSGDSSIRVAATGSALYVGAHPLRAAVRLETTAGAVYHRRVTGVSQVDASTEAVSIDAPLGVTLQIADVRALYWMSLARLDTDAVELRYETDSIAVMQATVRLVTQ